MDVLKRELAPIVDAAWSAIEGDAISVLKANLSARRVVDFDGPKGFDFSAVNLGRLTFGQDPSSNGVRFGVRSVLPLIELRVPFQMDIWELDNLARGADNVETTAVIQAALKLAAFEERAIYNGFEPAGVHGLRQCSPHTPLRLGGDAARYPDAVARAMLLLSDAGVGGPYALVLGDRLFRELSGDVTVYPPLQRISKMIDGPILHSAVLDAGLLVSTRGGDFRLTVGQDASIGYEHHDQKQISLYLTESFTFRVLTPEAAVVLDA